MSRTLRRVLEMFLGAFGDARLPRDLDSAPGAEPVERPEETGRRRAFRALFRLLVQPLGGALIALCQIGALFLFALLGGESANDESLDALRHYVLVAGVAAHGLWVGIATKSLLRVIVGLNAGMLVGLLFYQSTVGVGEVRKFTNADIAVFFVAGAAFGLALGACGRTFLAGLVGLAGGLLASFEFSRLAVIAGMFARDWWAKQVLEAGGEAIFFWVIIVGTCGYSISWLLLFFTRFGEWLGETERARQARRRAPAAGEGGEGEEPGDRSGSAE